MKKIILISGIVINFAITLAYGGSDCWKNSQSCVNEDLIGVNLHNESIRGVDFSGANLAEANLNAYAEHTTFTKAHLGGAYLAHGVFEYANFSGATLIKTDFKNANVQHANFSNANLDGVSNFSVYGNDAVFIHTFLEDAYMAAGEFKNANFTDAILRGVNLHNAHIEEALFDNAQMQGAYLNSYGNKASFRHANLSKAFFSSGANGGAEFNNADFTQANLSEAYSGQTVYLENAIFHSANLSNSDIYYYAKDAKFDHADLSKAVVRGVFHNANFDNAIFDNSTLRPRDANAFNGASFRNASFKNVNFKENTNMFGQILASFENADIEGVDWSGTDLTGVTWTNGKRCLEGSIGYCKHE